MKLKTLAPRLQEGRSRLHTNTAPRITGRKLQRIRREHFAEHPLCVHCEARGETRIATQLDHRIPLFKGGRDDASNRQGLCYDCHAAKTKTDLKP